MVRIFSLISTAFCFCLSSQAQDPQPTADSFLAHKYLPEITIVGKGSKSDYQQLPEVVGTGIYAGKKNALIILDNVQGNTVNNNMRQVLGKVPGIHIWESDPGGIQIGIAARGLSPNRSWEFNIRQNGYDISADPFGYPEAYYNPQLEAVQRIEILRGQASLQYGPQFGGMVNYILRNGSDIKKKLAFETRQTIGSNALFNSFNALGGKTEKTHYYAFLDHRNGNGWRGNSRFYTNAGFATFTYKIKTGLTLTAEIMQSRMLSRQPGGHTDNMLYDNPQQSLRSRNWFDIKWTTPALTLQYQINEKTRWNTKLFAVIGLRNSVGYMKGININDSINLATGQYNERILNIDQYRNYAMESRMLREYKLAGGNHTFTGGIRLYTGETYRRADGKGSTGTDYDMTVTGRYPRDLRFRSHNAAAFVENVFRAGEKWLFIPGIRYEWLEGTANGISGVGTNGTEERIQDISRSRQFLLAGFSAEYHLTDDIEWYSSIAQAYRPIQFANLQAAPTTDIVDPDLKDARGYNYDLGIRGRIFRYLQFDLSGFYMNYDNRVGVLSLSSGQRMITNVGASISKGFEGFFNLSVLKALKETTTNEVLLFGSYSYTDARYSNRHKDESIRGKKVENAPAHIFRGGITAEISGFSFTAQYSFTDASFSDANNTIKPSANAQTGLIPAYRIVDLTASYRFSGQLSLKAGINNLFNEIYFTRRAGGYPGPGAMPADGRTGFITVTASF